MWEGERRGGIQNLMTTRFGELLGGCVYQTEMEKMGGMVGSRREISSSFEISRLRCLLDD